MGVMIILVGFGLAVTILVAASKLPEKSLKAAAGLLALVILAGSIVASSVRHIDSDEVGIVVKNIGTRSLQGGAYIAVNGEQGVQADVLAPGWHFWFWPIIYDVQEVPLTEVPSGQIAIIDAKDGLPLPAGQVIAPEWKADDFKQMLDARYFLTTGKGVRGTQASVLTPGKYRLNTALFTVKMVPVTEVLQGEVAVLKANFGTPPTMTVSGVAGLLESTGGDDPAADRLMLAREGEMGIRHETLPPGKYPINTDAYTVVEVWTTQMIAHYSASASAPAPITPPPAAAGQKAAQTEEREITVRTSDGFTFPVDVRIEYIVEPKNAPVVVAKLGDDEGERFRNALNSAVRAIFRNNAESVRALDYVQQRSHQEQQSLTMLAKQMERFGVTVTAVRIGDIGDEKTLGNLLKTQTDREIAKQELLTFQEQQKAAEQKRQLSRATQEAEEEKRLATAAYAAKIAEETKKQKITEAMAEAEAITIRAKAQSDAYKLIADQIGKSNAALIEVLKIVGERNIQIAPRVMVTGGGANNNTNGATTALIGTMLDSMMSKEEPQARPVSGLERQP
jgi:uncharacterized membrane protein YqiK